MRLGGSRKDIWIVLLPSGILLGFALYVVGGPEPLLRALNDAIPRMVETVRKALLSLF